MEIKEKPAMLSGFVIFLLALCTVAFAATMMGLVWVRDTAVAYENSMPYHSLRRVTDAFEASDFDTIYAMSVEEFKESLSPIEGAEGMKRYYSANTLVDFKAVEAVKRSEFSYKVVSNGVKLADVTLTKQVGAGKRGFDVWGVDKVIPHIKIMEPQVIEAPKDAYITLNGSPLWEENADKTRTHSQWATFDTTVNEDYGVLPQGIPPATVAQYKITGLINPPKIETPKAAGALAVESFNEKSLITTKPDDKIIAELTPFVDAASRKYANYITDDAKFADVKGYFLTGTDFYIKLSEFYNGWYNIHEGYTFANLESGNWQALDNDHISCEVTFTYTIKMGWREFVYPTSYRIFLVRSPQGFKISNLISQ